MKKSIAILGLIGLLAGVSLAADNLLITDPTYIGTGARPLGMGKAYVALAEDADGVFINPAALGKISQPKLTSMYSNVLGDVNYVVLGGAYPVGLNSAIGAGIVRSGVEGIDLYDSLGTSLGSGSWGNSVAFLSYGQNFADGKLSLGASMKYYNQGGTGTATIESASASGLGFDLGAIYSPTEMLSLGISAQNPLGTRLENGLGAENKVQSIVKMGANVKLEPFGTQKMNVAVDADLSARRPTTYHAGIEYMPVNNIALRVGLDQDPGVGGLVETNPTAGVGLKVGGMQVNYAYHPYSGIADNATHYISLAYVGPDKPVEEDIIEISLSKPIDKSVIYADNVEVAGSVKSKTAVYPLKVNGVSVPVDPTGKFSFNVPVDKVGKKLVVVEAAAKDGRQIKESRRVLRLVQFTDVGESYWARKPIEYTGTVGLVQGYPDGKFKPEASLTRAEMATLLVRAEGMKLPYKPRQVFKDVKTSHWAANYIEMAVRMGLVKGYPDGKFRPNNKINKAETVAVLARYDKLALNPVEVKPYSDIKATHWAAKYIQAAKGSGMLGYIEGTRLRPGEEVNRAEAVEMLSKTNMASKAVNDLLSWDKGYEFEISRPTIRASIY
ncbi:MAG: PorV/PorQ family protein [Candidatus Margulisiibacteriota bacterium]